MAQIAAPARAIVSGEPVLELKVEQATVADEVVLPPTAHPASRLTSRSVTKPALSTQKAPPKLAASPPPAIPLQTHEKPVMVLVKPEATPPLDIKSLEARLKETKAIGAFTKLKLKTQMDELLGQLRAYYQGQLKTSLTDLRRSYDSLVIKVLALLQDADPQLATAIAASREPIWGVLSSPAKFATM